MRARYYSPDMRRFINADIIAGSISNAVTLNRFAYANGNPVSNIDPFGLRAERLISHAMVRDGGGESERTVSSDKNSDTYANNVQTSDDSSTTSKTETTNRFVNPIKSAWNFIKDYAVNYVDNLVSSAEVEVGLGYGFGASVSDIGGKYYKDVYLALDDGEVSCGNIVAEEFSVGPLSSGDTYKHCTNTWSGDYYHCSHCWIQGYSIEAMTTCPDVETSSSQTYAIFTINDEGDFIIGVSADFHPLVGGHVSIGFNVTEYIERLFD